MKAGIADVIDEKVGPAEGIDCGADERWRSRGGAQVHRDRNRPNTLQRFDIACARDYVDALLQKRLHDGSSDPPASARHDGDTFLKPEMHDRPRTYQSRKHGAPMTARRATPPAGDVSAEVKSKVSARRAPHTSDWPEARTPPIVVGSIGLLPKTLAGRRDLASTEVVTTASTPARPQYVMRSASRLGRARPLHRSLAAALTSAIDNMEELARGCRRGRHSPRSLRGKSSR